MRRHQQIALRGSRHLERFAQQGAGDRQLIVAEPEIEARCHHHRGMVADAHRDIEHLAARVRGTGQNGEMMIRGNADERAVAAERHQAGDRQIGLAGVAVPRDNNAGGDVGATFMLEEARDRQFIGERWVGDHHLLAGRHRHLAMRQRRLDGRNQRGLQLVRRGAQSCGETWQRIEQVADHRRPAGLLELRKPQRRSCVRLGKTGGELEITAHRFGDGEKLPGAIERGQKSAHGLPGEADFAAHAVLRLRAGPMWGRLG